MKKDILLTSLLIFSHAILVYIAFMTFYPFTVVELTEPITVTKSELCAGEEQGINLRFKKNYNIKPEVDWHLVNGYTLELPGTNRNKPVGKNDPVAKQTIPTSSHEGEYFIEIDLTYDVFPLRRPIVYTWASEKFFVKDCSGT